MSKWEHCLETHSMAFVLGLTFGLVLGASAILVHVNPLSLEWGWGLRLRAFFVFFLFAFYGACLVVLAILKLADRSNYDKKHEKNKKGDSGPKTGKVCL